MPMIIGTVPPHADLIFSIDDDGIDALLILILAAHYYAEQLLFRHHRAVKK